ncbi:putative epoxide hydrolase [Podospora aff. communis PSN243]|uniref:Epoxide hydrolase n=1 Tax=Podospora aff. communis PSN243 TaxID=3040156 RepID=A0AAV9GW20_9PEZI|nr:putative epoxide hydrolase [Podospora aff. communis PSN243]
MSPPSAYGQLPAGVLGSPVPFTLSVPEAAVAQVNTLVSQALIDRPTWYNGLRANPATATFGLSRSWLSTAQSEWATNYSWSDAEAHLNSFPNFMINVTTTSPSNKQDFNLHFAALFSKNESAIPVILMHGWPGSWFEFAGVLDLLADKYTPETLPYHFVVPSIPDYGLSTRYSETDDDGIELTMEGASEALHELMKDLGFNKYVAEGGDVGSFLAQTMCWEYTECRAFHLNMLFLSADQLAEAASLSNFTVTPAEKAHLKYADEWGTTGKAYASEHATRPSTISLVVNTNPLAMLAWIGEKLIEWSDYRASPSLESIITHASYYWYTGSFGRSMWAYRSLFKSVGGPLPAPVISLTKPLGYSNFPDELAALPQSWAEHYFPNLVYYNNHDVGGHFAAMEQPAAFLSDLEEFLAIVGPGVMSA